MLNIIIRYFSSTIGLFFIAFGAALSVVVNLGTAPLSCIAYLHYLKFPTLSFGTFTFIVNTAYILIQISVLRKRFKPQYLLQIIASIIFSYMIDYSVDLLQWLHPVSIWSRIAITIVACFITAIGTSLEVFSNAWMTPAEMTVYSIQIASNGSFSKIKIAMDSLSVGITAILSLIYFSNPFGKTWTGITDLLLARSEGIVIGIGTLLLALLPGYLLRITDKPVKALLDRCIPKRS